MDRTKLITSLVILCLASAVAAFLMRPPTVRCSPS